jgi:hypothetical protein
LRLEFLTEEEMNTYKHISTLVLTALVLLITACKETPPEEEVLVCETEESISYQEHIYLILEESCNNSACHNTGFPAGDFTTIEGLIEKVNDGTLLERLDDGTMPPISPLSDEQLQAFVCWIADGHLNN